MTYHARNTPLVSNKDAHSYIPYPISKQFSLLLGALAIAIEAERDIENVDVFNPAFDGWLEESERAWDRVTDIQLVLKKMPIRRVEDQPLKMLGFMMHLAMSSETRTELQAVQSFAQREPHRLQCPGRDALAHRITSMLAQGQFLLGAIGGLEVFQPVIEGDLLSDTFVA
ncbi:hypothetical protein [Lentibacter sp. XHP0401]|uniref:hypothetical protein n=1 Tax=Lentibacter sp. XHP0401 TaxID=2984334 RepID=UPI0021E96C55|nr:hypothetical protein [Lentibacter sp. XHP0401]MCV2894994.1 hypothetical protein [Lentibacter sp. XHP0401]